MSDSNESGRKFKWVGTRPIRHDGIDKVTGRANYGADLSLPGMLHACVHCPPLISSQPPQCTANAFSK